MRLSVVSLLANGRSTWGCVRRAVRGDRPLEALSSPRLRFKIQDYALPELIAPRPRFADAHDVSGPLHTDGSRVRGLEDR